MRGKRARMNAGGRILVGMGGSEGAREAYKSERLRPDSSRDRRRVGEIGFSDFEMIWRSPWGSRPRLDL